MSLAVLGFISDLNHGVASGELRLQICWSCTNYSDLLMNEKLYFWMMQDKQL